jgi:hypothetical protein
LFFGDFFVLVHKIVNQSLIMFYLN